MRKYLLIDIGGTTIKVATYEEKLNEVKEYPTEAKLGAEQLIDKIIKICDENKDVDSISISSSGQVDAQKGYIIYANNNMPGYTGTKWKEILEAKYHIPVFVENDVNAAAIGEGYCGSGKDVNDFLCLTYGTGVGGAIVINKEIYRGATGSAGELGSILIHSDKHNSNDPFSGGYERYASTTALVNMALEKDPTLTNGRIIFARINEPQVKEIVYAWAKEIALGLVSLIHIFNPELVILGGGIMEQELLFNKVNEIVMNEIMESFRSVKIVRAKLGNKAGLYGALARIEKELKK